jgi:signal transduction histidine kinase
MRKTILAIFCLSIAMVSCQSLFQPDDSAITIERIGDPSRLPFRFVQTNCPGAKIFPLSLNGSQELAAYYIENDWHQPDTISSVLFKWLNPDNDRTIRQINISALEIQAHYPADLDHDGSDELAITYVIHDTLWLEILDAFEGSIQKMMLAVGGDRNQSGFWDSWSQIFSLYDIDDDGSGELFIDCCSGYDLYPRKVICADWKQGKIAWEYDMPGIVSSGHAYIVDKIQDSDPLLIFGVSSPCNGAEANGMDDCHSYLICMSPQGQLIWKHLTGPEFVHTMPQIIDYDHDDSPDILTAAHSYDQEGTLTSHLLVCDLNGETRDSIALSKFLMTTRLLDIDGDENEEVCITFDDNSVDIYSQDLDLIKSLDYSSILELNEVDNFLNRDDNQILASIYGSGLVLFDKNFKPLAFLETNGAPSILKLDSLQPLILASDDQEGCLYMLESAPWYSMFSRYPFLAFLAGFLPLAIVAMIAWIILFKFRQKNIVISTQRDSLDAALKKLQDTQEKLIDAEKYKQAKNIAGSFAHEIRNALFPAKVSLKRITEESRRKYGADESLMRYSRFTNDAISKAIELTVQISEYTRLDSLYQPEDVNIRSVIEEVLEANQLRLEDRAAIIDISGDDQICIESNRRQFFSVINNLLLNSMDACPEKTECRLKIRWFKSDPDIKLEFSDNGSGIPEERLRQVFDAFCSYKEDKGIGLGLAIVKRVVEMYDGSIKLESKLGEGTKFTLSLKGCPCASKDERKKIGTAGPKAAVLPYRKE